MAVSDPARHPGPEGCLAGGGDMGALMRSIDWSATPLGPVASWPQSLRTTISLMLESRFAMVVAWGRDYRFFYNDRYRPVLGAKHPASLGKPGAEIFPEVWSMVGPEFDRAWSGDAFEFDDWLLPLDRNGYLESCWFTVSYSPIRDESGGVGGVLAVVAETTRRVESERRVATLRELARRASETQATDEACRIAAAVFEQNPIDVPFALLYLLEADGAAAELVAAVGLDAEHPAAARRIALAGAAADAAPWPLRAALAAGGAYVVDCAARVPPLPGGAWPEPSEAAVILPLARPGLERPYGVLVAGVSPRRRLDEAYRGFFELAADHITTAIANAHAFESERRRAEALAEIDRAKTAFFGNVSHEFRTPLTLMLGPVEDALTSGAPLAGDVLRSVHRNALRLHKLVNALLDFSRIEAGRMEAVYEPVDLGALTADLASSFRSTIERGGLALVVDVDALAEPAWVDRQMWEKVVLNLLSNAFKFTFAGRIDVRLRERPDAFELEVRDTGTGIPTRELPHLFERFRRIEGARARTEEGSGIGLALVQELVRLHGGEIAVESELGIGSSFKVAIPRGSGHLPPERLGSPRTLASTATGAAAYVEEALRWLDDDAPVAIPAAAADGERVLVADDNADMRDYLRRILGARWQVEVVADGAAALQSALARPPDLVLTDVMMPGLDGFALLRALRADPRTRHVPVVMLSARAGEEARVEGLGAGADEYLVKPFSARELVARVSSQLALSRERAAAALHRAEADLQRRNLTSLLMQAPTPICILRGPRLVVELANPQCCAVWGRRLEEVIDRPLLEAIPELADQDFDALLQQVMSTGIPVVGKEHPAKLQRDGGQLETVYFNFLYEPLRAVDGTIEGVTVIAFDVTDEVNAREQVDRLRLQAEAANLAKDEFLAMLSHELRNPLSPMLTAVELLRLRSGSTFGRELDILDRQSRHMVRLVDDLLDVSRLTRGKITLAKEPLEIATVVTSAIEMVEPLLEERRHQLVCDVAPVGLRVDGDPQRLAQVFANLLANAARYTQPGGRIEISAAAAGDGEVVVRVRDNGSGIPADVLPHVFDLFVQGEPRSAQLRGGLGIGLAIVRSLVTLHGGSVSASSEGPGRGSELVVRLPRSAAAIDVEPVTEAGLWAAESAGGGQRILVVDDNRDAADLLAEALRRDGYRVRVAYDGPMALAAATELEPDVALLDIGLPVQDGYEVARQLRDLLQRPALPLIAVSGYAFPADQARSREAGFHAHLVKPLEITALRSVLVSLLAGETAG